MNYYYIDGEGREIGPVPVEALRALRNAVSLSDSTLARPESGGPWASLSSVIGDTPTPANAGENGNASLTKEKLEFSKRHLVILVLILVFAGLFAAIHLWPRSAIDPRILGDGKLADSNNKVLSLQQASLQKEQTDSQSQKPTLPLTPSHYATDYMLDSVTTKTGHELGNISKCVKAGFSQIVVISVDEAKLDKLAGLVARKLGPDVAALVGYYTPDGFLAALANLPPPAPPTPEFDTVRGWQIKSKFPAQSPEKAKARNDALIKFVAEGMKKAQRKP